MTAPSLPLHLLAWPVGRYSTFSCASYGPTTTAARPRPDHSQHNTCSLEQISHVRSRLSLEGKPTPPPKGRIRCRPTRQPRLKSAIRRQYRTRFPGRFSAAAPPSQMCHWVWEEDQKGSLLGPPLHRHLCLDDHACHATAVSPATSARQSRHTRTATGKWLISMAWPTMHRLLSDWPLPRQSDKTTEFTIRLSGDYVPSVLGRAAKFPHALVLQANASSRTWDT